MYMKPIMTGKLYTFIYGFPCWRFSPIVAKVLTWDYDKTFSLSGGDTYKSVVQFDFDIFLPAKILKDEYIL